MTFKFGALSLMSSIKYGLVDCNNFFVSCERVFNPKLWNRPVVVLSNNDGCVIARSKEAKALSIPMGAPAFQYKQTFLRHDVAVLSSNFSLYGDMSERVMATLEEFGFPLETYSIDEAFLELPSDIPETIGTEIRNRVLTWTGIPISLGVGITKTLAKVGSDLAKKRDDGIFFIRELPKNLPVQEIWGIGSRTTTELNHFGIRTALELIAQSDTWIEKYFPSALLRVVLELRGTPCLSVEEIPTPRKSIVSSRSFGDLIKTLAELKAAVASFVAIAAEKLRQDSLRASHLGIFVIGKDRIAHSASSPLSIPTSYTPHLIKTAHGLLEELYQEGSYRKAGVMLSHLVAEKEQQLDFFAAESTENLMPLMDQINRRKGKRTLFFAAEGINTDWQSTSKRCSAHFTTKWNELLKITI